MADPALNPGDFFADSRYELIRLLGEGSMSHVWEATATSHGGVVALKILAEECTWREGFAERLRADSTVYAELEHRHIARVLNADLDSSSHRAYVVRELIRGKSLRQILQRNGKLRWQHALLFMLPVAEAIAYAHSRGALHGNLKPENLMISVQRETRGLLKVLDFGVSKYLCAPGDGSLLPSLDAARYMAPEGVKSLYPKRRTMGIDARSDIYSFGVVCYEMNHGAASVYHRGRRAR